MRSTSLTGAARQARGAVALASLALACLGSGRAPAAGAVSLPQGVDPVPMLRTARVAWDAGDAERAEAALLRLAEGPLADHAALLRARLLHSRLELDGAREAAQDAIDLDPSSELMARAFQELARIQVERGDLAAAYRAQRAAWQSTESSEVAAEYALDLARMLEARGLPGDSLNLYTKIWQRWPRSSFGAQAFERDRFLRAATGAPEPDPEALIEYADSLRRGYRCDVSLPIYEELLARPVLYRREQRAAERGRAECLFQRRRYTESAAAFDALARADRGDVDAAIRAARSRARAGNRDRAVKELSAIARRTRGTEKVRAQYLVAVLLSEPDPASAGRLLQRIERQRESVGYAHLARWRLAWEDLRAGRTQAALRRLRPLARGSPWDIEVQRALYWTAVAKLELEPEAGRKALAELAERLPLSYYGLLAADRIGVEPQIERSFLGAADAERPFLSERRALWLMEGGFPDAARLEVDSWVREGRMSRQERMAAAALLHALGDHFRAVRILIDGFGGALEQGIDPEWRDAWRHAWPQPFGLSVRAAVQEFEFDPALVYAVMREESTYRPRVESPAGALGLMQIVPPTGARIATRLGVNPFAPARLFEPDTNIRFGTFYLKDLMRRFDGSQALAIAAYNAGPEVVSSWAERLGADSIDAFVDSVPYSETRRYLRKVLRSYRVYRLLYAGSLDGAAPEPPAPARPQP